MIYETLNYKAFIYFPLWTLPITLEEKAFMCKSFDSGKKSTIAELKECQHNCGKVLLFPQAMGITKTWFLLRSEHDQAPLGFSLREDPSLGEPWGSLGAQFLPAVSR